MSGHSDQSFTPHLTFGAILIYYKEKKNPCNMEFVLFHRHITVQLLATSPTLLRSSLVNHPNILTNKQTEQKLKK